MQLIENIPDKSLKAYAGETIEPDDWDLEMIKTAEKENDGTTVSIESLASELKISL